MYSGLPWWATILSTALVLRVAMFPLFLRSSDSAARQAALASVLKPYNEALTAAQKAKDRPGMMLAMSQKRALHKKAGISTAAQVIPMLLQSVVGFCGFRLMKAMVALPVPGLMDGGFLWLQDLTLSDGYLILPLFMAGTLHVIARYGGESGGAQLPPQMQNVMLYFMPVLIALLTAWQPGAVCLWFCGSGAIGLAQAQLLHRPAVRRFFRLAPTYKPKPGEEAPSPFTAMLEQMTGKKAEPSPTPSSGGAARGTGQRPGVAYANPRYQAPNVHRSQTKTIDARLVSRTGKAKQDMGEPAGAAGKGGIFSGIKESIGLARGIVEASRPSPEKKREEEQKAFKRRAEAYEKRARERGS